MSVSTETLLTISLSLSRYNYSALYALISVWFLIFILKYKSIKASTTSLLFSSCTNSSFLATLILSCTYLRQLAKSALDAGVSTPSICLAASICAVFVYSSLFLAATEPPDPITTWLDLSFEYLFFHFDLLSFYLNTFDI